MPSRSLLISPASCSGLAHDNGRASMPFAVPPQVALQSGAQSERRSSGRSISCRWWWSTMPMGKWGGTVETEGHKNDQNILKQPQAASYMHRTKYGFVWELGTLNSHGCHHFASSKLPLIAWPDSPHRAFAHCSQRCHRLQLAASWPGKSPSWRRKCKLQ